MHVESIADREWIAFVPSAEETDRLGRALATLIGPGVTIGLVGPLGAGKTRLSRAIAEALGVDPLAIASPTFVLIHEYTGRIPVYHFDTYRLNGADDFDALGADEYWGRGDGLCLIEWADRVLDRLPADAWLIRIEADDANPEARTLRMSFPESEPSAVALAEAFDAIAGRS